MPERSSINCYGSGDTTTKEYSTYVGMASGWVTGIGKTYLCWYDLDSTMLIGKDTSTPQLVRPVESIGTKVSSGVNDEGDQYTGGLVDRMTGYDAAGYAAIAAALNANFAAFPADITVYGLTADALRTWTYDAAWKLVVPGADAASVTYVQPACEKVTKPELKLLDGVWYGRDADKTTVVKITVADGEITETAVVSGESSGAAYDAALAKAEYKATYGDISTYDAADPAKFAGGSGTQADPYRIATEAQLRYLAESINADVDWCGAYFLQTEDIALSGEWLPIGWALNGEVNGKKTAIAAYPFRGNYDGGDHTISGLRIGSKDAPADQMASGLFGLTAGELSTNDLPTDRSKVYTAAGKKSVRHLQYSMSNPPQKGNVIGLSGLSISIISLRKVSQYLWHHAKISGIFTMNWCWRKSLQRIRKTLLMEKSFGRIRLPFAAQQRK